MYWLVFKVMGKPAVDFGMQTVFPCYPGGHRYGDHGSEPPVLLPFRSAHPPLSFRMSKAGLNSTDKEKLAQAGAAGFPLTSWPGNPILSMFSGCGAHRRKAGGAS